MALSRSTQERGCASSGLRSDSGGPPSRPAVTDLHEVSVIAGSEMDAEIYAKTALLLGTGAGEAWLRGRALGWSLV